MTPTQLLVDSGSGVLLQPVIQKYFGDESLRKCRACGHTNEV